MKEYNAEIDGIPLDIQDIRDDFPKSVVEHEFPYRDGAELEDMGLKARAITFRCYFYNDRYEDHIYLLEYLKKKGLLELVHPKYGILQGSVRSISVRHDDRERTAEIDLTFVEHTTEQTEPEEYPEIESASQGLYEESQLQQAEEFEADMRDALGTDADTLLEKELDPGQNILQQFDDITGDLRDFVSVVDGYVSTFQATLNGIANPANSLIATINYATNLPGVVIGAIAQIVERYSILYDSMKSAPSRFIRSFNSGILQLEDSFPDTDSDAVKQSAIDTMQKHIQMGAAQRLGLDISGIYKSDERERNKRKRIEKTRTFDAHGNYIKPDPAGSIMTVDEIEKTLYDVRTEIQTAVDSARSMTGLKEMARQLLIYVNRIKIDRGKIVEVDISNDMPLHAICLKYGLPYNFADRVHALNNFKNPNFIQGEIRIYAQ